MGYCHLTPFFFKKKEKRKLFCIFFFILHLQIQPRLHQRQHPHLLPPKHSSQHHHSPLLKCFASSSLQPQVIPKNKRKGKINKKEKNKTNHSLNQPTNQPTIPSLNK